MAALLCIYIITVRNSRCRKVMFLHLSVILFAGDVYTLWADTPLPPRETPSLGQTHSCFRRMYS